MKTLFDTRVLAIGLLSIFPTITKAWEKEEHRLVADSALAGVLVDCGVEMHDSLILISGRRFSINLGGQLWEDKTFGEICAWSSGNDGSYARFQERGRTILQQLKPLSASLIDALWQEHSAGRSSPAAAAAGSWPAARSAEQSSRNVIVNYLLHHLIALRFAKIAGQERREGEETLRRALIYEAMALSYLGDGFSAGHVLVPLTDVLSRFHSINSSHAHDFYRSKGVYVINSRGEVWKAFGDKLLHWYAPSYRHVLEACITSLRELFLVYYVALGGAVPERLKEWGESVSAGMSLEGIVKGWITTQDGEKYYSITKMPTLLRFPMPTAATWSVRTEKVDNHGIHRRMHFPQLREPGFHDPDLEGIDVEFLFPRTAIPSWMIPDLLNESSPAELIKSHPDLASVRYIQERDFPPSYVGFLLRLGGGVVFKKNGSGSGTSVGLGYGFVDDFLVIQKISVDAELMPSFDEARRLLFATNFGLGIKLPAVVGLVEASHFEAGYAWGLRSPFKAHGFKFAAGLETRTFPVGFTYAGITVRLLYQRIALERTLHGVFLNFILH